MKVKDFYSGFEGEPELRVSRKENDKVVEIITMWIGFFDSLVSNVIRTEDQNSWEGILKNYHEHSGWYDEETWKLDDISLLINQLESISLDKLDDLELDIRNCFVSILKNSIHFNQEIYFEYS